jgi:hypothetical protein
MAKQGQHKDDRSDPRKSRGPNKPSRSVTITTGSYKKPVTYAHQAAKGQARTGRLGLPGTGGAKTRAAPTPTKSAGWRANAEEEQSSEYSIFRSHLQEGCAV